MYIAFTTENVVFPTACLAVMESWDVVLVSRFLESQSRRFEVLSWSAKIWFSTIFVNQRVSGLLCLQVRNNQSR